MALPTYTASWEKEYTFQPDVKSARTDWQESAAYRPVQRSGDLNESVGSGRPTSRGARPPSRGRTSDQEDSAQQRRSASSQRRAPSNGSTFGFKRDLFRHSYRSACSACNESADGSNDLYQVDSPTKQRKSAGVIRRGDVSEFSNDEGVFDDGRLDSHVAKRQMSNGASKGKALVVEKPKKKQSHGVSDGFDDDDPYYYKERPFSRGREWDRQGAIQQAVGERRQKGMIDEGYDDRYRQPGEYVRKNVRGEAIPPQRDGDIRQKSAQRSGSAHGTGGGRRELASASRQEVHRDEWNSYVRESLDDPKKKRRQEELQDDRDTEYQRSRNSGNAHASGRRQEGAEFADDRERISIHPLAPSDGNYGVAEVFFKDDRQGQPMTPGGASRYSKIGGASKRAPADTVAGPTQSDYRVDQQPVRRDDDVHRQYSDGAIGFTDDREVLSTATIAADRRCQACGSPSRGPRAHEEAYVYRSDHGSRYEDDRVSSQLYYRDRLRDKAPDFPTPKAPRDLPAAASLASTGAGYGASYTSQGASQYHGQSEWFDGKRGPVVVTSPQSAAIGHQLQSTSLRQQQTTIGGNSAVGAPAAGAMLPNGERPVIVENIHHHYYGNASIVSQPPQASQAAGMTSGSQQQHFSQTFAPAAAKEAPYSVRYDEQQSFLRNDHIGLANATRATEESLLRRYESTAAVDGYALPRYPQQQQQQQYFEYKRVSPERQPVSNGSYTNAPFLGYTSAAAPSYQPTPAATPVKGSAPLEPSTGFQRIAERARFAADEASRIIHANDQFLTRHIRTP